MQSEALQDQKQWGASPARVLQPLNAGRFLHLANLSCASSGSARFGLWVKFSASGHLSLEVAQHFAESRRP
uniref:Uncharacterized protein n=1 Tax=uncultured bacterium Bal2-15 TaxID=138998 RepID=Q99IZ0_9BACT|nr:unknown [uncultured bacterium Bal2-15]